MNHSEIITKILSDLDLDKIYSFYSAFGDTSDPEYYKKIPSFIKYPEEWENKPLTVDLIKTSLSNAIKETLLKWGNESMRQYLIAGFMYLSTGFSTMVVWEPAISIGEYVKHPSKKNKKS